MELVKADMIVNIESQKDEEKLKDKENNDKEEEDETLAQGPYRGIAA